VDRLVLKRRSQPFKQRMHSGAALAIRGVEAQGGGIRAWPAVLRPPALPGLLQVLHEIQVLDFVHGLGEQCHEVRLFVQQ
jgi:hypothetical protein